MVVELNVIINQLTLFSLRSFQMLTNSFDDFVMTTIKCPPPKIVAVKRNLRKSKDKTNIMDDEDLCLKEDFINDNDSLSSFDSKDLIEFERDEPLIDLSDADVPSSPVESRVIRDTVSSMNAKNSTTLLSLLDLLEIGNVMRATETELLGSCAKDNVSYVSKTSSSSSSVNFPVEGYGACATTSGKTNKLSSVFPPLSIQPENPSIVKNYSPPLKTLKVEVKETLKTCESAENKRQGVREGIDEKFIDSTSQNSHQCQNCEKLKGENFISTSTSFSCADSDCSIKACCCTSEVSENSFSCDSSNIKNENCHFNHHQQKLQQQQHQQQKEDDVKSIIRNSKAQVDAKASEQSDTNNNSESVCNQNQFDFESLSLSRVKSSHEGCPKSDESVDGLKFLSPHTSQRKLPPKFFSSTTSLNQDCFEASSRLKRLEERFKGFSYTKKLLRSSKLFSKSEEILSSYGKAREFKCEPLNSSIHFPLSSSSTLSENCLRQLTAEVLPKKDIVKASSSDEISGKFFFLFP